RYLVTDRIAIVDTDVDAQHLPEQLRRILRAVAGVAPCAAVTEADVQVTIRSEHEIAAIVIRKRLRDERRTAGAAPPQVESRHRVRHRGIVRSPESRDDGVTGTVGEVDEEPAARRGVRRKREPQETLLAAGDDRAGEVEKIPRQYRRAAQHSN